MMMGKLPFHSPAARSILVVDDLDRVRETVRDLLREDNYQVLEARSGSEAIKIFEHSPASIDLLVTDVRMPGMSGPELARHLGDEHPGMPVLFMSADPALRFLLPPGGHFLSKPFDHADLTRKLGELMKLKPNVPQRRRKMSRLAKSRTNQRSK
jgi:two-component system cell cycle sensor histidine kinase/response regulator CckA